VTRVLVVEDEPAIASFIEKGLRSHGFTSVVVADGRTAAALARDDDFDLMILDLNLPLISGLEVMREVRGRGERLPVIVLTARDDKTVEALDAGADDYVRKPFDVGELLARMRARLRNAPDGTSEGTVLRVGAAELDLLTRRADVGGRAIELTAREFALAETFFRHPDQVLSREQLLNSAWGYDFDPGSNLVEVYVRQLRKKLGDHTIETIRGMGYRLRR
jgi:DNA-binding response OmpR family regulator